MNTENDESLDLNNEEYQDRISKREFQITPLGGFHLYEGFWHSSFLLKGFLSIQDNFCAKPTDILLTSFPKSGSTWLKALTFAIVTRKRFNLSTSPLLTTMPHDCVPFLEIDLVPNSTKQRDPELPLLASHVPYTSLPRSIITSGCKIIYIYREPKDVFVSLWHYVCKLYPLDPIGLQEFFDLFMKGFVTFGPIWDHVLSYYNASLERPGMILLLRYENLLMDTELYVKKLAEFLECPFSLEEEKEGAMEKLVKLCNFENLSNLDVNKTGKQLLAGTFLLDNSIYFRKGRSGDWINYLTPEMAGKMDKITDDKFGSCDLMDRSKSHP